jgi:hypothetical protein
MVATQAKGCDEDLHLTDFSTLVRAGKAGTGDQSNNIQVVSFYAWLPLGLLLWWLIIFP